MRIEPFLLRNVTKIEKFKNNFPNFLKFIVLSTILDKFCSLLGLAVCFKTISMLLFALGNLSLTLSALIILKIPVSILVF